MFQICNNTVSTYKLKVSQTALISGHHAWSKWDVDRVGTLPSPPSLSAMHLSTVAWLWNVMFRCAGCCSHGSPSTWTGVFAFSLIYRAQKWPCEIWSCHSGADKNFNILDMMPCWLGYRNQHFRWVCCLHLPNSHKRVVSILPVIQGYSKWLSGF